MKKAWFLVVLHILEIGAACSLGFAFGAYWEVRVLSAPRPYRPDLQFPRLPPGITVVISRPDETFLDVETVDREAVYTVNVGSKGTVVTDQKEPFDGERWVTVVFDDATAIRGNRSGGKEPQVPVMAQVQRKRLLEPGPDRPAP